MAGQTSVVRTMTTAAAALVVLLTLLTLTTGLGATGWLAGIVFGTLGAAALAGGLQRYAARSFGPADHVTLVRAVLVGGVTAIVADTVNHPAPLPALITITAVALALDAVDGQVARRTGTVSPLGARFDMEVDAFLILVLSVFVATALGPWVLMIGGMRYAFVAAGAVLPWLYAPLPPSMMRKTVAAAQGVLLTVAAAGLPVALAAPVALLALGSLTWSFGHDVRWLYWNRVIEPVPVVRLQPVHQA